MGSCDICEILTDDDNGCLSCPLEFEGDTCTSGDLDFKHSDALMGWTYHTIKARRNALIERLAKNGVHV